MCVYLITGEMKDLFGGSSAIQCMEKTGPGNNCWTVSKVVDEIFTGWKGRKFSILVCMSVAVCTRYVHTYVMTVYLQDQENYQAGLMVNSRAQHWCGIPVCCKYLSVGVGPGSSCWKIAAGQKTLHSSRTSA